MPLIDIISELATDVGNKLSNPADKIWLIDKVNKAAKAMYDGEDLRNSEREQVFNCGSEDQIITTPWNVGKIYALRDYDNRIPLELIDWRPRYKSNNWNEVSRYKPRRLNENLALSRDIDNEGQLTFTLSQAASVAFSIIIIGRTVNSQRVQENILVAAGNLTKNSTNAFREVESIRKSSLTLEDITITDIETKELAVIPNHMYKSSYTDYQVLDIGMTEGQDVLLEVLYKHTYVPMRNDYDSFICGDDFDEAIYWKTLARLEVKKQGREIVAGQLSELSEMNLAKVNQNKDASVNTKLIFKKNSSHSIMSKLRAGQYRRSNGNGNYSC